MQFSPKSEKEALQDAMKGPDLEPHPMYNQVRFSCCAIPALPSAGPCTDYFWHYA